VANFVAIILSAITPIPALRAFAFQMAITVFLNYFLLCTAFVALLSFDLDRRLQQRFDVLFCVSANTDREAGGLSLSQFMGQRYGRALTTFHVQLVFLTLFLILVGMCIWGTTQVVTGIKLSDVALNSSPENEFLIIQVFIYCCTSFLPIS
jgi:Sterol-sensing domain of SREBP cleavage-activation